MSARTGKGRARKTRANGEGSIFPYRNGYAAYVLVTTPTGQRRRKYVYGQDRDDVHRRWIALAHDAQRAPVETSSPTVAAYLARWLAEVVRPNLAPATAEKYESLVRHYVVPDLGSRKVDRLTVREVQGWVNRLRDRCQCCAQGKDASRARPRCCAAGTCCAQAASARTIRDVRDVLRSALGQAERDELVSRNVASLTKLPAARAVREAPWSVEEARRFLQSARDDADPYYAAYVLLLVLGLRRGEVLGLSWSDVDLDAGRLTVAWQLQRVGGQLMRRQTKTAASDAALPLPDICLTTLQSWRRALDERRQAAGQAWDDWGVPGGLVVTTRHGGPVEPRNFYRSFQTRCRTAGVRPVGVHATRRTCASLLAALDVHPRVAMHILRHSQIAVTMNVYTETYPAETTDALRRLGDEFTRT